MKLSDRFGKITIADKEYLLIEEAVLESMLKENTLNRDKVKEIFTKWWGENDDLVERFMDDVYPALCSLSLPTLSEEEIDELWDWRRTPRSEGGLL
jgi:hypothetical protein